jgi:hypothetical protein
VRKLKISLLAATVIGFLSLTGGCKKTYTTNVSSADSVLSSPWMTFQMDEELIDQYGDSAYFASFNNSAITQAVVNDGVLLSYFGVEESTGTGTTTDTLAEAATEFGAYTTFAPGSVTIETYTSSENGAGDLSTNIYGYFYRYVIVPGSVLASTGLTKQQAKSMTYTALTAAIAKAKQTSNASITQ